MNTREVLRVTIIFAVLTIAGIGLAVIGPNVSDSDQQLVLVNIGSAIFAGALAFFLVEMFGLYRRAQE